MPKNSTSVARPEQPRCDRSRDEPQPGDTGSVPLPARRTWAAWAAWRHGRARRAVVPVFEPLGPARVWVAVLIDRLDPLADPSSGMPKAITFCIRPPPMHWYADDADHYRVPQASCTADCHTNRCGMALSCARPGLRDNQTSCWRVTHPGPWRVAPSPWVSHARALSYDK